MCPVAVAQPLIEVLSVAIFPKSLPCQVYGEISLYGEGEGEDTEQTHDMLYERDIEHSELVSESGQALLLTGPKNKLALAMPKPEIRIRLMHRCNDGDDFSLFVSGQHCLDNTTKDDCEAFRFCLIEGQGGVARVNYAAMVARYGKTYGPQSQSQTHLWTTTILKTQQNESSIPLDGDVYFKLTKRIVGVPAYSSLIITADLREQNTNKQILHGTLDTANTRNPEEADNSLTLISKYACLFVSWSGVPEGQPSPVIKRSLSLSHYTHNHLVKYSESLLEIYSVFIGRDNDAELSIFGDIRVARGRGGYPCVYHRELDDADKLARGKKLLSITGPCSPAEVICFEDFFSMNVDLQDAASGGRFLIECSAVDFNADMISKDQSLYNKLLCSIIQGVGGYCAVHYTPFRNAVTLQVKCFVSFKTSTSTSTSVVDVAKVYGIITASYDMFKYTFEYDRKYFRRLCLTMRRKFFSFQMNVKWHFRPLMLLCQLVTPYLLA